MASFGKTASLGQTTGGKNLGKSKGKGKGNTMMKGTFGHVRSRDRDGKLFSLDRTLSESCSDIRFPDSGLELGLEGHSGTTGSMGNVENEVFEPNSTSSPLNEFCEDQIGNCGDQTCHQHHFKYLDEDDEFSMGLPSDIPSGLVDIEGNIIGDSRNVRFGQDDDDDDELNDLNEDEDDDELSSLPDDFTNYNGRSHHSRSRSRQYDKIADDTPSSRTRTSIKMGKNKNNTKLKKELPDFRNPHQFNNGFIQLRSHRGRPNSHNNNNNELGLLGRGGQRRKSASASSCSNSTITQHYYPEGGWGYVVLAMAFLSHALLCGIHLSSGIVIWGIVKNFGGTTEIVSQQDAGWLAALSVGVSLFLSPIWVAICKNKSTRLAAVFGGLVASLGCLFTSFASQFHQLFLSYGAFMGIGIGLTRDASSLMVGQYFKRKRDLVEVIVVSASGFGILLMSASLHTAISSFGWRLGLQAITVSLFLTFFLGTCYRSASLYHPQRRAILHLKNQKRKVKEREKLDDHIPFLDFSCLRSKTVQILLLSVAFTAFGINTPLFYLAIERDNDVDVGLGLPIEFSLVILHVGIGVSWILGCFLFGLIVIQKNQECRVSKQYLCQIAGVISGISILALATTEGFNGLVIFSCVYGFSLGGYNYALKVYTYERVRARHFPRAWSFIQSSQAIPIFLGVPLAGYLNANVGWKSGYYLSAVSVMIGSVILFLTDVRKRKLSRRKAKNSSVKTLETTTDSAQTPKPGRLSFSFPIEQLSPQSQKLAESIVEAEQGLDPALLTHELTCISAEEIPGMDLQNMYFDEWADYLGGDITSCNKVENCLVSEFDADHPVIMDRRSRRWSTAKSNLFMQAGGIGAAAMAVAGGIIGMGPIGQNPHSDTPPIDSADSSTANHNKMHFGNIREIPIFRSQSTRRGVVVPSRPISVIDEASV